MDTRRIDRFLGGFVERQELPFLICHASTADKTIYSGAFGNSCLDQAATQDTILQLASVSKAMTVAGAMQLWERGLLDLTAPLTEYRPEARDLTVFAGWDRTGSPITRPLAQPITIWHLLTHTSGMAYEFWNADVQSYLSRTGTPGIETRSLARLFVPLVHDPGAAWTYGISTDWLGLVIEAISGQRLDHFLKVNLFDPLAMADTSFFPTKSMTARQALIYERKHGGGYAAVRDDTAPENDFVEGGGGLLSTCADVIAFMRMLLNYGKGPNGQVLASDTVRHMTAPASADLPILPMKSVDPGFSLDVDLLPGVKKSWSLAFMMNEAQTHTGRSRGSGCWAGMFNTYYWVDFQKRIAGITSTQLLPFCDTHAVAAFNGFEKLIYAEP